MITANVMEGVRLRLTESLPDFLRILSAGLNMGRTRADLNHMAIDPLAEWYADGAIVLLQESPPRVFEAYVCFEIAAAREPEAFGTGYRGYRNRVMRSVLGGVREKELMVNVADTTVSSPRPSRGHGPARKSGCDA